MVFIPISDDNPLRSIRYQWVTIGLIAANVIAFFLTVIEPGSTNAASFAMVPRELFKVGIVGGPAAGPLDVIRVPEGATLLTYMFLHGDILHLLSNMLFLWVFGDNVEDALGHARYLGFYLACGIVGGLAHAATQPDSGLPLIGASGAVAGVIGAYLLLHPRVLVWVLAFRFIPLKIPAAVVLGVWAGMQILMLWVRQPEGTQVAWWAHIGGFVCGAVLVIVLRRPGVALFDRNLRRVGA
ncbi:MAG: rhomboid family intramembrane serine protease [Hyphomicrobiaceae bacterium]|nr:rhomboid family intramembrane serine protease [Hyphomicrobiaceae bacterium]